MRGVFLLLVVVVFVLSVFSVPGTCKPKTNFKHAKHYNTVGSQAKSKDGVDGQPNHIHADRVKEESKSTLDEIGTLLSKCKNVNSYSN